MNKLFKNKPTIICVIVSIISIIIILSVVLIVLKVIKTETVKIDDIVVTKIENNTQTTEETIPTTQDYILMRQEEIDNLKLINDEMIRFIKYKGICFRYENTTGIEDDVLNKLHSTFTLDEIYLMQRVIETECYQCDFMSKVNVASVLLNRVENGNFGNNIEEIITNKNQFAYGRRYIAYDTILALEYASYYGDSTNGALYFHSNEKTNRFSGKSHIFTDDAGHHFYG